jgi:hypothetical protein
MHSRMDDGNHRSVTTSQRGLEGHARLRHVAKPADPNRRDRLAKTWNAMCRLVKATTSTD